MIPAIFCLCGLSFVISWLVTYFIRPLAVRLNFVDKPGGRKIHARPKPLGGGVAIFLGFAIPMAAGLVYINLAGPPGFIHSSVQAAPRGPMGSLNAYWSGARQQTPLALALLLSAAVMHVLGLRDDKKAMGPYSKLLVQLGVTAILVVVFNVRALTVLDNALHLGSAPSMIFTILWIGAITNAFNFLDNMDGLSSGVAAVCTMAFLVTALSIQQWFVAASLAMLLGALGGFLWFNFPPATIFMGDSGSLVIGFMLGVLTVRTTYIPPEQQGKFASDWYAVFAPAIVMALPLYDLLVVSALRIMKGKSPFVGDTNHFSHRLVARGMSRRTAVLCLYLVSAATAIAAILLPQVRPTGAMLIFLQTLLILGVVALLEQHPLPAPRGEAGVGAPGQPGAAPALVVTGTTLPATSSGIAMAAGNPQGAALLGTVLSGPGAGAPVPVVIAANGSGV